MRKSIQAFAVAASLGIAATFAPSAHAEVVEVVTLKLKPGVSYGDFTPIDKAIETQYASKQPGFISRESAAGENGEWLVIIHWQSVKDAEASMAKFSSASAAQKFMDSIDASSLAMKRYTRP